VIEARVLQPAAATAAAEARSELQSEVFPKDSRDSTRKRKSKSPHVDSNPKKQKRRAAQQAESRIQLLPKGLVPRTPRQEPLEMRSSDENDSDNSNAVGRKQKSILQPSGGKYSKKAAARRRGLSALQQLDGSQDEEDGDNNERALSEESPIPTMHNSRDPEEFTNPQSNRSSLDAASSPDLLPRKYLELKVVEYDLPSTEPQGPGDLWTCTFEGCFNRVHEASTSEGKTRMKEHFRTHASQAQEKIDLVLNERRPYLPVK